MLHSFSFAQGSTYGGAYTTSVPIVWSGVNNQTISGLAIKNPKGNSIKLTNCNNITITNCKLGPSLGQAIDLANCTNITVTNCSIDSVATGLYSYYGSGIKFNNNDVRNVFGPLPKGQMVQFDRVSGGGNSISYNACENIVGQSNPEDVVSLYMVNGLPNDRVKVIGNWIRGGGPSTSGGGIMTGDNGGSYILVRDNILVNPGQYGIALASGNHITITNNMVYSAQEPYSNVGIYAYNQYPSDCSSDTISNNVVNFTYKDGQLNNFYNNGSCGTVIGWSTNTYSSNLNSSILPTQIIGKVRSVTTGTETPVQPATNTGSKIKVYPNPATDHVRIETTTAINDGTAIIYNLNGKKMIEQSFNESNAEMNTGNLAVGVYIVVVKSAGQMIDKQKVVIVRPN
jgi:Predicted signal transduction protein containing sensor and EAL domains